MRCGLLTAFSRTGDLRIRRAIARLIESVAALRPADKSSSKSSSTSRRGQRQAVGAPAEIHRDKVVAATPMRP